MSSSAFGGLGMLAAKAWPPLVTESDLGTASGWWSSSKFTLIWCWKLLLTEAARQSCNIQLWKRCLIWIWLEGSPAGVWVGQVHSMDQLIYLCCYWWASGSFDVSTSWFQHLHKGVRLLWILGMIGLYNCVICIVVISCYAFALFDPMDE